MTINKTIVSLAKIYHSGKPYCFLQLAHDYLRQEAMDSDLALLTLKALVEMGYGSAVGELVDACPSLQLAIANDHQLGIMLQRLPDGRVPWHQCSATFEANAQALLDHRPQLAPLIKRTPDIIANLDLFRSLKGEFHLSRRVPNALRQWLPNLQTAEQDTSAKLPPKGKIPVPAIIGLRFSPLLGEVYANTRNLFLHYSHPMYFVEHDAALFVGWMHCADHTTLLNDERAYFLVGGDATQQLYDLIDENSQLVPPMLFLNLSGVAQLGQETRNVCERLYRNDQAEQARTIEALNQEHKQHDSRYWNERLQPPAKVLALTSRFTSTLQYAMRDALAAFRKMGYETEVLVETKNHHRLTDTEVTRAILEHKPDLLFFLDHLRYECPHIPKNIPFLSWIQDDLPNVMCTEAGRSVGELDFVCGNMRHRCVNHYEYPPDRFLYLDIPVCTEVFHDEDLDEDSWQRYGCDVSFVSNSSIPIDEYYRFALRKYRPEYYPLLEGILRRVKEMLANDEFTLDQMAGETARIAQETNTVIPDNELASLSTFFAYRILDWGRRQQTLEWVADWAQRTNRVFKLYGRGWEKHPTLAPYASGIIEHGEPLRQACRGSKLSLQLIPSGFRHQRSYEILASGSLPLTRYCLNDYGALTIDEFVSQRNAGMNPPGEKLFTGLERITFRTAAEFEELAEHFLANKQDRSQVRQELRRIVIENCTYDSHIRKVMSAFQRKIQESAQKLPSHTPHPCATAATP